MKRAVIYVLLGSVAAAHGQVAGDPVSPKEIALGRAYIGVLTDARNADYITRNGRPSASEEAATARIEAQMAAVANADRSAARRFADMRLIQLLDTAKLALVFDLVKLRVTALSGEAPPSILSLRSTACLGLAKESMDFGRFEGWRIADVNVSDCLDLPIDASLGDVNAAVIRLLAERKAELENKQQQAAAGPSKR